MDSISAGTIILLIVLVVLSMLFSISESSFLEMLRNVFYIGKILVPAYKDEPEQVVQGIHEPLISEEIPMFGT